MTWQRLGAVAPTTLRDARVQLHWAAQVLGGAADAWIERRPDDGHTNMEWSSRDGGALVGNATRSGLRLALRLPTFELVARRGVDVLAHLALRDRTLGEALAWADRQIARAEGEPTRGVKTRDYDMPDHAVRSQRAPFDPDPEGLAELARWYDNGDRLLRSIESVEPGSTPIRCWPHHFDIAGIVYLTSAGASGPQIGYGLEPGDQYYEEPYFYLTAWPRRPDATFPALDGGGTWRQGTFTGAVLLGSSLASHDGAAAQEAAVHAFFASAFDGARTRVIAG